MLDKKLLFREHINYALEKGGKCFKVLYSILCRGSKLNTTSKLLLYKTVLRPIILYGSPVWDKSANMHLNQLQLFQNRLLRICLQLPFRHPTADTHEEARIEYVREFTNRINCKFKDACRFNGNRLISQLANEFVAR